MQAMLSVDEEALLSGRFEGTIVVPPSAVPPHLLQERARREVDRWDEMWEGVLHMVPPPAERHQRFGAKLLVALYDLAQASGFELAYELGFYRADDDYRAPDLAVYRLEDATDRGVEGAELVVETVSPGDQSWAKLPWYAARGVREVLLVHRDTLTVNLFRRGDADLVRVEPTRSDVLGCTFERVSTDHLRITSPEGPPADIRI